MLRKLLYTVILVLSPSMGFTQQFLDISSQVGINHSAVDALVRVVGGVVVFDYDNDQLVDVFLPAGNSNHKLYKNLGGFKFEDVSDKCGIGEVLAASSGANAADLNNDGWEDLFITTREGFSNVVLINNQDGTFTEMSGAYGFDQGSSWGSSVAFADFNNDGILDVYVGNYADYDITEGQWELQGPFPNQLFISQGDYQWKEMAAEYGVEGNGYTLVSQVMDFDLDGDMDIYVGNDFGPVNNNQGNVYYENVDGHGTFVDRSVEMGLDIEMFAMGIGSGDFDEDGDIDLYLSDIGHNKLLEYQDGSYINISNTIVPESDYVSWNGSFIDGNNDGSLDLFVVNGVVFGDKEEPLQYYEKANDGYHETKIEGFQNPFFGRGMGVADLDLDGDMDVVIHSVTEDESNGSALLKVLKNTVDNRHDRNFLQVRLEGTSSNRNGYGSVLRLHLSDNRTLLRTLENGGGYMSGGPAMVHFGLDDQEILSLDITWPDGNTVTYQELPKNSALKISQTGDITVLWEIEVVTSIPFDHQDFVHVYPTNFESELNITGIMNVLPGALRLFDLSGRNWELELTRNSDMYVIKLSTLNLSPGMYFLNLVVDGQMHTFKLWKNTP